MSKILIVEDNESNMKLFCDLLQTQGYDIVKSFDGENALELLKNNSYNLLILDIQLPRISGIDLMKRLQSAGIKRPKTIVVSAYAMQNEIRVAKAYGCECYITKPIDIVEFLKTVKRVLGEVGEKNV